MTGQAKPQRHAFAESMASVWMGSLAFCLLAVADVFVDGLFRLRLNVLLSAFCGAALPTAVFSVGAAILLWASWLLFREGSKGRAWGWRLLTAGSVFVYLAGVPFLAVYLSVPNPPVHLWRDYLFVAVPVASALAVLAGLRLAPRWPANRTRLVALGLSLVVVSYLLGSAVPRDLHFEVTVLCGTAVRISWFLVGAALFFYADAPRRRVARYFAAASGLAVIAGALAQAVHFANDPLARDLVVRGSELLRGTARISVLSFDRDVLASLERHPAADLPAPDLRAVPASFRGTAPSSIILITVDALRLDALRHGALPTFARLEQESLVLTGYASSAAVTAESLHALFYGRTTNREECQDSVFERLRRGGIWTIAVALVHTYCTWQQLGPDVLVDMEDLLHESDTAPRVLAALAAEVKRAHGPFFAWAHLMEPHLPYDAEGDTLRAQYQGEVQKVDRALGEFLQQLEAAGTLEHTALIITGDHGEELGEHAGRSHSRTLYEETLRVPLLLRYPGVKRGQHAGLFSAVDVMPTILDLMAVAPALTRPLEGLSLFDPRGRNIRFAQLAPAEPQLRSVQLGSWKLIVNDRYASAELYNLQSDPPELENRVSEEPGVAATLARMLREGPHQPQLHHTNGLDLTNKVADLQHPDPTEVTQ
ncbi:MAG TPA: sulfatase-like hydrolase/transferase [Polyangiales bacterium]|nr:sulfatase-like hydrolase/transferase [Polyangiales bacterium]